MGVDIRVNDIGTQYLITILNQDNSVVNIANANPKQIVFEDPNGVVLTKNGTLYTDGTDGKLYYISVSGDFKVKGWWELQGYVVISGSAWRSSIEKFKINRNLSSVYI